MRPAIAAVTLAIAGLGAARAERPNLSPSQP
jgi:hypothetical protein